MLGRSVNVCADPCDGCIGLVNSGYTKICDLDDITVFCEQQILRFYVAVYYPV